MALAHQITNQPLLSSPPCLARTNGSNARTARTAFLGHSCCLKLRDTAMRCVVVRASSSAQAEPKSGGGDGDGGQEPYEEYEVEILKPYGLKFAKGRDGGTYIEAIFPGSSAEQTGKFTVGDKVIATSAVFGEEIWPAAGYGQTMYCIRQRVGPLYMKMQKKFELSDKEVIRAERNTGNVSTKLREIQMQNYQKKMEQEIQREDDLRMGLKLYKDGKYEDALEKFESVLGSKPEIDEASVASYNVACCYSKLDRIQAGLSALEEAMKAGYEDFKRIRTDPDLANLRNSEEFATLLNKYDESFINENAINAIKSIFGFGYFPVYALATYVVYTTTAGVSTAVHGGVYAIGAGGYGGFFLTWVAV
ncbi:protein MET1, chloroplastic isoform X5 [Triticum aestivum]|uniref:protein MET1, chloroplastic isoform X5 n=1 Tax=Triticum aestivum TaxID=4565 RepID=UPI001D010091|nr:protein MET1, chloroplastic-like isoform X5 [Triticum aestivum]